MLPPIRKVTIQVEFDCSLSPYRSRNHSDPYLKRFLYLKKQLASALKQFMTVQVVAKQPPMYYTKTSQKLDMNMYLDTRNGKSVRFPRKDSFEVTIDSILVFSRLKTGEWPNTKLIADQALKAACKITNTDDQKQQTLVRELFKSPKAKPQINSLSLPPLTINYSHQNEQSNGDVQKTLPEVKIGLFPKRRTLPYDPPISLQRSSKQRKQKSSQQNKAIDRYISLDISSQKSKRGHFVSRFMNDPATHKTSKFGNLHQTINLTDNRARIRKEAFTWHFNSLATTQDFINSEIVKNNFDSSIITKNNLELQSLNSQVPRPTNSKLGEHQQQQNQNLLRVHLKVSESVLNCNRDSYQINRNKIAKKYNEQTWAPLLCEDALPLQGQYYFSMSIVHSKSNMIQIGIVPLNYHPKMQSREQSERFLCINCSDGMIRDARDNSSANTKWRMGGEAAPRNIKFQLKVVLNFQKHSIQWRAADKVIGRSQICTLFQHGCKVFISLYDVNDCVILNEEKEQKSQQVSIDFPEFSTIVHSQKNQIDSNVLQFASQQQNLERILEPPSLEQKSQSCTAEITSSIQKNHVQVQTEQKGGRIVKQILYDELEQRKWNKNRDFLKEPITFYKEQGLRWTASFSGETLQYQLIGISTQLLIVKQSQIKQEKQAKQMEQVRQIEQISEQKASQARLQDEFDYVWQTVYQHCCYKLRSVKS